MRRVPPRLAWSLGLAVIAVTAWWVTTRVDGEVLRTASRAAAGDPVGLAVAFGCFGAGFVLRSWAWRRVVPRLGLAQAWSAIHLSLAANHLLPLRLGEAVRPLAAHRRTGLPMAHLTASTLTLRAADIVAMGALAAIIAPEQAGELLGPWGWAALALVAAAGSVGAAWLWRLSRADDGGRGDHGGDGVNGRGDGRAGDAVISDRAGDADRDRGTERAGATRPRRSLRLPGPGVALSAGVAWMLEAVLVHRCAAWAGHPISASEAVLVTVAAVSAQVAAIAPGGIGTYEAAATAALVMVGAPTSAGLAIVLVAHGLKTTYALGTGAIALVWSSPPLPRRLRLRRPAGDSRAGRSVGGDGSGGEDPDSPGGDAGPPDGPVVLVVPARDEAPRIAAVIARLPPVVGGRPTECLVVDDGSTDGTAEVALAAGAVVVRHEGNRGLGAAVRCGLAQAVARGAAVVAFCDADGEYAPEELPRLVAPILAGRADYVVGSRFRGELHHMRPHRRLGNVVLTAWVRWMARAPVTDGQSGFRALSRDAAAAARIIHDYNYAQVLTLDVIGAGYRYAEVPISYHFRRSGRSFVRLVPYLRAVVPAVHRQLNRRASLTGATPAAPPAPDLQTTSISTLEPAGLLAVAGDPDPRR